MYIKKFNLFLMCTFQLSEIMIIPPVYCILFSCLQAAFTFSLVWSVGGACDADSRAKFSEFFRRTVSGKTKENPIPQTVGKWECPMDEKGQVYDYFYEVRCYPFTQKSLTCGQSEILNAVSSTV